MCEKEIRGDIFKKNIGGYLDRLESVYGVIGKVKPFNAKPMGRVVKYRIRDNFLNFWFRFIHKNRSALETGNFGFVLQVLERDFATYSGLLLEKLFHDRSFLRQRYVVAGIVVLSFLCTSLNPIQIEVTPDQSDMAQKA